MQKDSYSDDSLEKNSNLKEKTDSEKTRNFKEIKNLDEFNKDTTQKNLLIHFDSIEDFINYDPSKDKLHEPSDDAEVIEIKQLIDKKNQESKSGDNT